MDYKRETEELCKVRMKKILSYFIAFCELHGLKYYCSQGTCLGVMRHQGFIPWDDDIDVMMPRPDYNKLLELLSNDESSEYELVTPYNTPDYYLPFAKLVDKKSTIIERRKIPCTLGLFLDIFPINGMPYDSEEIKSISDKYCLYRNRLTEVSSREGIIDILFFLLTGQFGRFGRSIMFHCMRQRCRKRILKCLNEIGELYPYDSAKNVSVEDSDTIYFPFPKDWLDPSMVMSFEDIKVSMPNNSDDYLRHAYGDYMTLPPEEQRINNHMESLFYFNLNEKVDFKCVSKEIRRVYFKRRLGFLFKNR